MNQQATTVEKEPVYLKDQPLLDKAALRTYGRNIKEDFVALGGFIKRHPLHATFWPALAAGIGFATGGFLVGAAIVAAPFVALPFFSVMDGFCNGVDELSGIKASTDPEIIKNAPAKMPEPQKGAFNARARSHAAKAKAAPAAEQAAPVLYPMM